MLLWWAIVPIEEGLRPPPFRLMMVIHVEQAKSIFYTRHSTLILPVQWRMAVEALLLECWMVGENKRCYLITAYKG